MNRNKRRNNNSAPRNSQNQTNRNKNKTPIKDETKQQETTMNTNTQNSTNTVKSNNATAPKKTEEKVEQKKATEKTVEIKKETPKKEEAKAEIQKDTKSNSTTKAVEKKEVKNEVKKEVVKPIPTKQQPKEEKKSKGMLAGVALLAGVIGIGISVYDYDQIRRVKTSVNSSALTEQIQAIQSQIDALGKTNNDSSLDKKLATLTSDLEKTTKDVNKRLNDTQLAQKGLAKSLSATLNETLSQQADRMEVLVNKIEQLELAQRGLSANVSDVATAKDAVSGAGMAKQEVGYLLRMADYKIKSESDINGAAKLLKVAEDKLLLLNQGKPDAMIGSIREKLTQLQGVTSVDSEALVASLKSTAQLVDKLSVKVEDAKKEVAPASTETNTESVTDKAGALFAKVGSVIASGVKYTPKDPSKIDISEETILIEKRLMQADIRTAELAVYSKNSALLAQSINSIKEGLNKYFADDETAQEVKKTLAEIEAQKLETVLPDLSDLLKQFEQIQ